MPIYYVYCTKCIIPGSLNDEPFRFYQLPDGNILPILTQFAYCYTCSKPVVAELIHETIYFESFLQKALQQADQFSIELSRRFLAWRKTRHSPAKCLNCGSSDIVPIYDAHQKAIEHPNCGGVLSVTPVALANSLGIKRLYTPEGNKI